MNGQGNVVFWRVVYAGAAVAALAVAAPLLEVGWRLAMGRLRPPKVEKTATQTLPLGREIKDGRERKLIGKVSSEYGRVKVLVDVARSKGADVAQLDKLLIYSLNLAKQQKYEQSLTMLNRIAMSVPRQKERVLAAHADDPLPAEPPVKAKAVGKPTDSAPRKARRPR